MGQGRARAPRVFPPVVSVVVLRRRLGCRGGGGVRGAGPSGIAAEELPGLGFR